MDGAAAQRSMRLLAMIRGILAVVVDILVPALGIDIIAGDPGYFEKTATSMPTRGLEGAGPPTRWLFLLGPG